MKKKEDFSIHESISRLSSELDILRKKASRSSSLEGDLKKVVFQRDAALKECDFLRKEVRKFNDLNDELRGEISFKDKLISSLKSASDELRLFKKRCSSLKQELELSRVGVAELQQSRDAVNRLSLDLRKFDSLNDSLRKDLDSKNAELIKLKESTYDNKELKDQIHSLEKDILNLNKLNTELRGFCSEKNKQMAHLNADIDSYKAKISYFNKERKLFESHKQDFADLERRFVENERLLASANNELISLKRRLSDYDKRLKDSDLEFEKFNQKFIVLDKQNKSLLKELDDANALIAKLKKIVSQQNYDLADKEVVYSEFLRASKTVFDERLDELSKSQADKEIRFRNEINILRDELEDKKRLLDEKDKRIKELARAFNDGFKELVYVNPEEVER